MDEPYEKAAWDHLGGTGNQQEAALVSIAVSLKRIADELESGKRDILAGFALAGILANPEPYNGPGDDPHDDLAGAAYDYAVAMMDERDIPR